MVVGTVVTNTVVPLLGFDAVIVFVFPAVTVVVEPSMVVNTVFVGE
jgi:hypothetical protein